MEWRIMTFKTMNAYKPCDGACYVQLSDALRIPRSIEARS